MDYSLFKDWLIIKYQSIKEKTKKKLFNNPSNELLYNPIDKSMNETFRRETGCLKLLKFKDENGTEFYFNIINNIDELKYIPFCTYSFQLLESITPEYDKEWYKRFNNHRQEYISSLSLLCIKKDDPTNDQILFDYTIETNNLYFKYVEQFASDCLLSDEEFFKYFMIERKLWNTKD